MNSFLILLLSTISRGADEPRFVLIQPTYSVSGHGAVLDDLESRMPAQHPYRDRDRITWAHETTHGLNSYIRNRLTNYARALERIARSPEITAYVRWQESEVARLLPPRTVGSRVYAKPWRRR